MTIIRRHVALSLSLFWRYGLMLTAIWAAGILLQEILLRLAVEIGLKSRLLGLVAIAPVILVQLLIFVAFFVILRRGAPQEAGGALVQEGRDPGAGDGPDATGTGFLMGALLVVLLPFYAYYAGWGLLGDTLRSYAQLFYATQIARMDYDQPEQLQTSFQIGQTGWALLAVAVVWLVRRGAKAMQSRSRAGFWPLLVVACEATWALLGLYVLSGWKAEITAWLASLPSPLEVIEQILPAAEAAISGAGAGITPANALPVDWPAPFALWPALVGLFWYALLPLVWFNLGAIVYGQSLGQMRAPTKRIAAGALDRWQALPKPLTDFIGHFWAGLVRRWHAVANGVLLAASAGVALTVSVLVAWRLVDWLGAWGWLAASRLIGPMENTDWQVATMALDLIFGAPGRPAGGVLVVPLQFCILAAGLQLALGAQAEKETRLNKPDAAPA